MQESDSQRLQSINAELMELYIQLHDESLTITQEQLIRSEISDLESERDALPSQMRSDDKVQQYMIILKSAATSLQLHRQSLQAFSGKESFQLSADEVRQKNILLNKLKSAEKKIDTYRQKLTDLELLAFEIDDVLLAGYREQNQRFLQTLLQKFEATAIDYLIDYFEQNGQLPDNFYKLLMSWEQSENLQRLRSNELQLLQLWYDCVRSGIPRMDIISVIDSISAWSVEQKKESLNVLQSKLAVIVEGTGETTLKVQIDSWMQQYDNNTLTSPREVEIVQLIKKMQMYAVSQKQIDAIVNSFSPQPQNSIMERLKRRFR